MTQGLVPCRIPTRRPLKGDDMDEHREAGPFPRKGQEVRVVDGPFAGFIGTVVDVDEFLRNVQIIVLFFGQETSPPRCAPTRSRPMKGVPAWREGLRQTDGMKRHGIIRLAQSAVVAVGSA